MTEDQQLGGAELQPGLMCVFRVIDTGEHQQGGRSRCGSETVDRPVRKNRNRLCRDQPVAHLQLLDALFATTPSWRHNPSDACLAGQT